MVRSGKKCVSRYAAACWLLAVVLSSAKAQELVSRDRGVPMVCLNGSYDRDGRCVCDPGYSFYKGNCFLQSAGGTVGSSNGLCPPGMGWWNGACRHRMLPPMPDVVPPQEKLIVVPPLRIEIPTPELIEPVEPNAGSGDPEEEDDDGDDGEPAVIAPDHGREVNLNFQKVVNNHNVIDNATIIHTHNQNNVVVHFSRRLPDGAVRTVVIRNNETTVYDDRHEKKKKDPEKNITLADSSTSAASDCEDSPPTSTTEVPTSRELPCCTVVSPRVCRKQQDDEWVCFHRKQVVCSTVCTADEMYLRPRRPHYRKPWLVMPPLPNPFARFKHCRWGRCPRLDCSGCIRNATTGCHPMCSTYDCAANDSCHFIDRDLRCPDPSNELCVLLDERTIDLMNPGAEEANE